MRYSRLHEKRIEVVAELYQLLVDAGNSVSWFVECIRMADDKAEQKWKDDARDKLRTLSKFFSYNRIYLSKSLCQQIESIQREIEGKFLGYMLPPELFQLPGSDHPPRRLAEDYNQFAEDFDNLREKIEEEFRNLLGSSDEIS